VLRLTVQTLKIVSIATVAILILVGARAGFDYAVNESTDARTGQPVAFQVTGDDNADTIAGRLADADLIRSPFVFTSSLTTFGGNLQPGDYTLERGMTVRDIVSTITSSLDEAAASAGGVSNGNGEVTTSQVTIIENLRMEQTAAEYEKAGLPGGAAAFMEATQADYSDQFPFLADRPDGATLEGYLFPETYTVTSDMNPEDAVVQMLTTFDERFTQVLRDQAAEQNLTMNQVLTLASIVEREAQLPEERPTIAAVYLNRLEAGMMLQADPTVQFVLGNESNWWPVLEPGDTELPEAESPYNTYANEGLPPGPICSPSYDSIYAVLNPDVVDYLYFVADGSGGHVFANTLEEQQVNIDTYLNGGGAAEPTTAPAP